MQDNVITNISPILRSINETLSRGFQIKLDTFDSMQTILATRQRLYILGHTYSMLLISEWDQSAP